MARSYLQDAHDQTSSTFPPNLASSTDYPPAENTFGYRRTCTMTEEEGHTQTYDRNTQTYDRTNDQPDEYHEYEAAPSQRRLSALKLTLAF